MTRQTPIESANDEETRYFTAKSTLPLDFGKNKVKNGGMKRELIIAAELSHRYPDPKPFLHFKNRFELIVAVSLSAQTTDISVNKVTSKLFALASTPERMAKLPLSTLEEIVHPLGFFRNKAKHLKQMAEKLVSEFNSEVPSEMKDLLKLAGVGRKTASIIRAQGFSIPEFPVDTHVSRIAQRLALSSAKNPDKISDDLMKRFPKKLWIPLHLQFISFGREICMARSPKCEICPLLSVCPFGKDRLKIRRKLKNGDRKTASQG